MGGGVVLRRGTGLPGLARGLGTCGPRGTRPRRRGRALRGWAPASSLDGGGTHNSQWGTGLGLGALRSRAPTSPPWVSATGVSRGRQRTNQKKPACCGGAIVRCPDQWALVLASGNKGSSVALLCRPMSEEPVPASPPASLATRAFRPREKVGSWRGQLPCPFPGA